MLAEREPGQHTLLREQVLREKARFRTLAEVVAEGIRTMSSKMGR
jgi:hypothetical protein